MVKDVDGYHFDTPEERTRPRPFGQLTTALNPPDWPEQVQPCGHPVSALREVPYIGDQYSHWCGMCEDEHIEEENDHAEND